MNKVLYDICLDAIEKLRSSAEGEQSALIKAAANVMTLINNVSKRLAYVIMEDVMNAGDRSEETVDESILKVVGIIDTLKEKGSI